MKKIVVDTSALMEIPQMVASLAEDKDNQLIIPLIVFEELDKHKDNNRDYNKKFKAKRAIRLVQETPGIEFGTDEVINILDASIFKSFDTGKNDNIILYTAYKEQAAVLSCDISMQIKAEKKLGLEVLDTKEFDDEYKGYTKVEGDTDKINELYQSIEDGDIELFTNQYIIAYNTDTEDGTVERWDGTKLVPIKIPKWCTIKAKNLEQVAALDLMFNGDIPIKVICGTYGSGKTFIAVKGGKLILDKGQINKMLLVRNPAPADGIDIGALPGDKFDKVGAYFKPMLQYLDTDFNPYDPENEKNGEAIECEIVSFMKGISVDDTMMIVDEAEDLNLKLLKMLGTRIGEGSSVVFTGDYKQAEHKYKNDNGLVTFIKECKGHPLVGVVILEEDVRSEASKVFADI